MKKNLLIFFFLIVAIVLFAFLRSPQTTDYVQSWGALTPIVLLLLISVAASLGIPFFVLLILAAILLNIWIAALVTVIGTTIGATVAFTLTRKIAPDTTKYIASRKKLNELDALLREHGFLTIFVIRQITLMPFELVNIMAGLSNMSLRDFFLGTLVGMIPGIVLTIYFLQSFHTLWSLQFYIASALITLFTFTPLLSRKVRRIAFG